MTETTTAINAPLKTHGGKGAFGGKLARWIIGLMPPHLHYVEPFAGGLAVLLAKDPADTSEVVNDINGGLTNFWEVIRGDDTFARFVRRVQATPFSEVEWESAADELHDPDAVIRAAAFFVRCRQSLAGRMRAFALLSRTRTRRGMNEQTAAWLTAVEGLPAVHERLKRVVILNRDALDVIRQQDGPDTLFYCDPPYLPATRTAPDVYRHEMTRDQHAELLKVAKACVGKVVLSGYPNDLYDTEFAGWERRDFEIPNNAAGGKTKRRMTERVWCNFTPPR